jgi:hypothetical protein
MLEVGGRQGLMQTAKKLQSTPKTGYWRVYSFYYSLAKVSAVTPLCQTENKIP